MSLAPSCAEPQLPRTSSRQGFPGSTRGPPFGNALERLVSSPLAERGARPCWEAGTGQPARLTGQLRAAVSRQTQGRRASVADPNTDARHGPLGFLSTKQSFERPALPLLPRVVTLKGDVWPLSARPLRARFPEGARRPPSNVPEGTYSHDTWARVNSWKGGQPASSALPMSQDTVRAGPAAWPSTHTPVRPCPGRGHRRKGWGHRRKGSVSASGPPFPRREAGTGRSSDPGTPSPGRQVPRTRSPMAHFYSEGKSHAGTST